MKMLFLIALSALSGDTFAQEATSNNDRWAALSDAEAMILFEKLMTVTSGDTEEDTLTHLRSHGMGEDGAKALKDFHESAVAEMKRVGDLFYSDVCSKQAEIRKSGGPEMVAQVIEQSLRQEADARRRLLAEADSLLSLEDQERLEHIYSSAHGPNVGITETNVAMSVRNGELPIEQVITAACNFSNKKEK